jgi:hypothetical protein
MRMNASLSSAGVRLPSLFRSKPLNALCGTTPYMDARNKIFTKNSRLQIQDKLEARGFIPNRPHAASGTRGNPVKFVNGQANLTPATYTHTVRAETARSRKQRHTPVKRVANAKRIRQVLVAQRQQ